MYKPLTARATDSPDKHSASEPSNTALIVIIISIVTIFFLAGTYILLRNFRSSHADPRYVPTKFLKSRWRLWRPGSMYGRMSGSHQSYSSRTLHTRDTSYNPSVTSAEPTTQRSTEAPAAVNGVDRNTSVRSVITLPAYNPTLYPSERLIAREGERAGVDTVVEFPETAEEEESRREEDMESLYQIRQARRREYEEREERRQERQAAREAGDWARLEQLRLQSQLRARARATSAASATSSTTSLTPTGTGGSGALITEHNARAGSRDRRVSSVSYADLGLARHDGSRLRADSVESNDQRPLLDSAASMGGSHNGSCRNSSLSQLPHPSTQHRRAPSAESFMTVDSDVQDTSTHGREPPLPPPGYDQVGLDDVDAPPYRSPVAGRGEGPRFPPATSGERIGVPAIHITGTTPGNSVPVTPVDELGVRGR